MEGGTIMTNCYRKYLKEFLNEFNINNLYWYQKKFLLYILEKEK